VAELGRALLVLALAVSGFGIVAALAGARTGRRDLVLAARRCVFAVAALAAGAFGILEAAFLRDDLSFAVVAGHSSLATPLFYKATAIWSSQEGSLLLWLTMLGLWSSLVLVLVRRRMPDVQPYAIAVLLGFAGFFSALLVFAESPFGVLGVVPSDGAGLNPLLRHPMMMSHPPALYSGYTLFAIPFAFAVGALIVRRADAEWIAVTRRFTLAAWFFLGVGIMLGARWSYAELGWGGYWAWDPVENASLLPWLTGTALLHSAMIQERRGMLKVWNATLALACGVLAILGTFLVRSGILDSIHAFGASTLGVPFVALIGVLVLGSVALVVTRLDTLRSEHRLDSLWSRESVFLLNNVVLVGLAFVVFWGTFFPLIAEALTGTRQSLGPPWFDRYTVPLALLLVLLSGVGPLIAWRRGTVANARRNFLVPALVALGAVVLSLALGAGSSPAAVALFACAAFVVGGIGQEVVRGVGARRAMGDRSIPVAAVTLVARNRRRYGGYVVHLGMAVLFVGVAASSAFQDVRDVQLGVGQTTRVGAYDVRYERATSRIDLQGEDLERIVLGARLIVSKDGKEVARLTPERGYYPSQAVVAFGPIGRFFEGEATSEIAMDAGASRDLWIAVSPDIRRIEPAIEEGDRVFEQAAASLTPQAAGQALGAALRGLSDRYTQNPPPASFRMLVSPMVSWLWSGALLVFAGALICLWPGGAGLRRTADARLKARVARDLRSPEPA
jgi:cytochrome c-type biogenesis protein CcmF